MDAEFLSRAKMQDVEREISRIRLAAAAQGPKRRRPAAPGPERRHAPAAPLRLLRALASGLMEGR